MDRERLQKALDSLVYLPHLKEKALHTAVSPVGADAGGKGRVWDRGDLFRRLQTYRPGTWFCKPDVVSPAECARRGWLNTAPDLLTCEFCKAKVSCPIPPQLLPDEANETAARYAKQLTEAHDATCPWRTTCCAASLLQFPPLTQEAALEDFRTRVASLQRLVCLPPMAVEAYERIAAGALQHALDQLLLRGPTSVRQQQQLAGRGRQEEQQGREGDVLSALTGGVLTWNADGYEVRLRLLALCGWDLRLVSAVAAAVGGSSGEARGSHVGPECSALTCTLCGSNAGLWTFFPSCRPQVQALPARSPGAVAGRMAPSGHGGLGVGTNIAGGSLFACSTPPGTAASSGPFGSPMLQPLFRPPLPAASPSRRPSQNIAGGNARFLSPGASAADAAAVAPAAAAAAGPLVRDGAAEPVPGPFGAGAASPSSPPIFGIAAQHSSAPVDGAAKRKQPDGATRAGGVPGGPAGDEPAEKRSRAGETEGAQGAGPGCEADAAAEAGTSAPPMHYCSTEALQRYSDMEAAPLDPLALHRAFCPWVSQGQGGGSQGGQVVRCGWKWCLQQLVPGADDGGSLLGSTQGAGEGGRQWDPALLLRAVLRKVDVHK